ncbi:MAG: hypothetical protein JOY71_06930 [Acetobacteraceae bacterium]|nr:hypothetical protein [Acetobacteraceae bacterium]
MNGKLLQDFSNTQGGVADHSRCDEDGNIWSAGSWSANLVSNAGRCSQRQAVMPFGGLSCRKLWETYALPGAATTASIVRLPLQYTPST